MNNFIPLELHRKIQELTEEYITVYSRRIEDLLERREEFSEVKKAAIIIDCHSSDEFIETALEDMIKVLRRMNETRSAKYTVLLWTSQEIQIFQEKATALEIRQMMPLPLEDRSQTHSPVLAEMRTNLRDCELIFTLSDAGFIYQTPAADVSNYVRLKERMIWILSDRDNKETYDQCTKTGFIKRRSVVSLNVKEQPTMDRE